jgi:ankyrin repeat protein
VACRKGQLSRVSQLLAFDGVDVNASDNFGWTPLHESACHGRADIVKLLLDFRPKNQVPVLRMIFFSFTYFEKRSSLLHTTHFFVYSDRTIGHIGTDFINLQFRPKSFRTKVFGQNFSDIFLSSNF